MSVQLALALAAQTCPISRRAFTAYLRTLPADAPAGCPGMADTSPVALWLATEGRAVEIYTEEWVEYVQPNGAHWEIDTRNPLPEWLRLFSALVDDERDETITAGRCRELLAITP